MSAEPRLHARRISLGGEGNALYPVLSSCIPNRYHVTSKVVHVNYNAVLSDYFFIYSDRFLSVAAVVAATRRAVATAMKRHPTQSL